MRKSMPAKSNGISCPKMPLAGFAYPLSSAGFLSNMVLIITGDIKSPNGLQCIPAKWVSMHSNINFPSYQQAICANSVCTHKKTPATGTVTGVFLA
jgi:hypothetical protein